MGAKLNEMRRELQRGFKERVKLGQPCQDFNSDPRLSNLTWEKKKFPVINRGEIFRALAP